MGNDVVGNIFFNRYSKNTFWYCNQTFSFVSFWFIIILIVMNYSLYQENQINMHGDKQK